MLYISLSVYHYFLDFTLVLKQHSCKGAREHACLQTSVEGCAQSCHNRSSMFAYATAEGKCFGGKCKCVCTTGAYVNGTCDVVEKTGYNLYTYVTESSAPLTTNSTDEVGKSFSVIIL